MIEQSAEKAVLYEKRGPIAFITFNRPKKINCMNGEVYALLQAAVEDFDQDPDLHCAIVSGAGGNFSSGGDFAWYREQRLKAQAEGKVWQYDYPSHRAMARLRKPVIAAIDGHCMAAGLSFAVLFCDIRIATNRAILAFPVAQRGLGGTGNREGYGMPFTWYMGLGHVLYMMLTGEKLTADVALRMGLVNEVVTPEQLMDRAIELAARMSNGSAMILGAYKELYRKSYEVPGGFFQELQTLTVGSLPTEDYFKQSAEFLGKVQK